MDFNTVLALTFTFVGVLVIGALKAYERITAPNSVETWDRAKFGTFVVVAGTIMLIEYFSSGLMAFPTDAIIQTGVTIVTPIASLFGLTYTALIGGSLVKRDVLAPIASSISGKPTTVATPKPTSPMVDLEGGCDVSPSIGGKVFRLIYGLPSPVSVQFDLEGIQPTIDHYGYTSVDIDWDDGTVQSVPLVKGKATIGHVFIFEKTSKYTGKTFNPVFTFNENTGQKFVINGGEGRTIEIGVEAP
jgi:hypothetical protein